MPEVIEGCDTKLSLADETIVDPVKRPNAKDAHHEYDDEEDCYDDSDDDGSGGIGGGIVDTGVSGGTGGREPTSTTWTFTCGALYTFGRTVSI
ncbi:cell division protease ftsH, putative [Babesia ovata]|uniref:Cell division protease ftsH, putative n=1 Tax=Babesia ovata TaxID=189622 RepID=A0A2H6K8Y3_9APIC|nr:cell division protease ftsH, putative [Babesia ovata]GBE59454.1 cell division protease ftsH, putative [Babesia ovata]